MVSYHITLVGIAPSFLKRMTPNCLGWLLTTSEQPTGCFGTIQGTKILEKSYFRCQNMNFLHFYVKLLILYGPIFLFIASSNLAYLLRNKYFHTLKVLGVLNHHFSHDEYPTIKNFPKKQPLSLRMFGSLMRKLLQLQLWNIAPNFVLMDSSCTGKKNSFFGTENYIF